MLVRVPTFFVIATFLDQWLVSVTFVIASCQKNEKIRKE